MEFLKLVEKRRSIRKYIPEAPSKDDIKTIINAARLAPSAHNKQMWHFIVVYNEDIRKKLKDAVANKYEEIKLFPEAKDKEHQIDMSKSYSTFFADAPVVIAVLMEPVSSTVEQILIDHGINEKEIIRSRPRPDLQSIGAALQSISLAAEDLGYGTCWCTAPLVAYKEMEQILNVDPKFQLVAVMSLGRPEKAYSPEFAKNRKTLEEILTIVD